MWAERGVNSAKPLFSQTRISGSCHSAARLIVSLKVPAWTAPSPKKTTATASLPRQPGGQRAAQRHRDVAADDAGRAEEAVLGVDEVHRAAHALAQPVGAAHQLGHLAVHRRALGERVAVGAVAAVDRVVVAQLQAGAGGDALLPDRQVDQPVDLVGALEPADALLEVADPPHRAQQRGARRRSRRAAIGCA